MGKKNMLRFTPHPDKVLVKITKAAWDDLFFKWITRDDGTKCQLFKAIEEREGFDGRFTQNVSVGVVVAVGANITSVFPGDTLIIDYLASNNEDVFVGYVRGEKLICLNFLTTYHQENARSYSGRRAFVTGDIDHMSAVLGVARGEKVIAFDPYIFLVHKSNIIKRVLPNGKIVEDKELVVTREVLSAPSISGLKDGDRVVVKEEDVFGRTVGMKQIDVLFRMDVLVKK